jgi:hypothetical protein
MRERGQSVIADAAMAPIRGPDGQALAAHGWHDAESIADNGGALYAGIEEVEPGRSLRLWEGWPARTLNTIKLQSEILG